jgi:rhamnosyltransferase subunit B
VIVIANAYFERAVEKAGLGFAPSTPVESYLEMLNNPDTWHPQKGPALLPTRILAAMPGTFERVRQLNLPGNTVIAATPLAFAATLARESLDIPLATVLLNPMSLSSTYDFENRGLGPFGSLACRWKRRIRLRLTELWCDRVCRPELNAFRASLGLRRSRRVWNLWMRSSQCIIGLWPEWLYAPQPDWPRHVLLAGFVEYDAGPGGAGPDGPARLEDAADRLHGRHRPPRRPRLLQSSLRRVRDSRSAGGFVDPERAADGSTSAPRGPTHPLCALG